MPTTYADPPPALVCDPAGIQYHMEKQLGRGGFAICWRAQQVDNAHGPRKTVAMKIVKSKMEVKKVAQKFVTELQLHSKLHHPHIVAFHQAFSFQASTYVVLELCSKGSLADWLKKRSYLSMPEIRRCIIQTCGAMKYLHMRNIVHRDLKAGNLFLDHDMNIKVGDFGLAAVLVSPDDAAVRRTTMCGTPNYIAPKILEKSGKGHNERVDIWAIGILAYTLAVGRAPFHASKPDQVLLRVARGEYAWPDLENHQNEIPHDLRKLVSQILVEENLRPSLDTIVSQDFFKMGYLPDVLSEGVLTSTPKWPIKPPSPTSVKRGYTEAWYRQCKASGVGEYAVGKFFSVVGNFPSRSIFRECEREAESGKMPVVPMPQFAIYVPFVHNRGKGNTGGLENIEQREMSTISSHLIESSVNTKYNIHNAPEPLPSKQRGTERHDASIVPLSRTRVPAFSYAERMEAARHPPVKNTKRTARYGSIAATESEAGKPIAQLKPTTTEKTSTRLPHTRSVRATSRTSHHDIPKAENSPSEPAQSTRETSWTTAREKAGITKAVPSTRSTYRTSTRARTPQAATIGNPAAQPTKPGFKSAYSPLLSAHGAATRSKDLITSDEAHRILYVESSTVLARAEELRNNISAALTSGCKSSSAFSDSKSRTDRLPFVCKWVDYSRKHGIGYVLAEGSVGVIANHTDDMPIIHTVVENGCEHFKMTYDGVAVKVVPYKFFMQADHGGLEAVTLTDAAHRQHSTLWAKFARYMCKHLNTQMTGPSSEEGKRPMTIVRFYQRMGNTSVWGFSNGCFQFNFPDHTKIVLSADGTHASFTVLPLFAVEHLKRNPTHHSIDFIKARKVVSGTLDQLLYGAQPTVNLASKSTTSSNEIDILALTTANSLPDKLHFVVGVVGYWISGGGLGCKPVGTKWMVWEGTTLDYAWGSKSDWITVGRFGGDEQSRRELEEAG